MSKTPSTEFEPALLMGHSAMNGVQGVLCSDGHEMRRDETWEIFVSSCILQIESRKSRDNDLV